MEKKIYLIGNAHIDPVWFWRWQEGLAEIKATFQSALDRMNEFPEYIFTCACAAYYEWVEKNEPAMFARIQERVAEGRWIIVGGWYIQPDCNIPSGESFARHGLYSQRYFQEKFGTIAKVGYNVDSFGHNAGIPQILKKSGMEYYVFMRPMEHEKSLDSNLFRWKGSDGSEIKAFRISITYNNVHGDMTREEQRLRDIAALANTEKRDYMAFFGVGNHGGGATIEELQFLENLMKKEPNKWIFSSPIQYFADQDKLDLPIISGDLQHHAPGCYSACSKIKADNRRAENTLIIAEQLCANVDILFNCDYPYTEFERAWKDVMFNQFHDILGGCSIQEAYNDAAMVHGEALAIGERYINFALQKISWNVDTSDGIDIIRDKQKDIKLWEHASLGTPVLVYNPLSWDVTVPVTCGNDVKYVTDDKGLVLPFQRTRAGQTNCNGDKYETVFLPTIPAYGYTVCRIFKHAECPTTAPRTAFPATDTRMENEFLRVDIDPHTGGIARLYRKDLNLDLLSGISSAEVIDEKNSDTWGHDLFGYHKKVGQFSNARVKLIETGPVRTVIRAESVYCSSYLRQDYTLVQGSRQVDVQVYINWQEKHKMLKFAFPVNVTDPHIIADAAYAHVEREANGAEDPCQQWVDLFGIAKGQIAGLALLNDSKYGYDAEQNVLRMTAIRSPIFADHFGERDEFCEFSDQGIHKFRYAVCAHEGNFAHESLVKRAYELNNPPRVIVETFHKGNLPCRMTGIKISASNIIATTLKKSEDGNDLILRCYETNGKATTAKIELPLQNCSFTASFRSGDLKTFRVPLKKGRDVCETDLLER